MAGWRTPIKGEQGCFFAKANYPMDRRTIRFFTCRESSTALLSGRGSFGGETDESATAADKYQPVAETSFVIGPG